MTDDSDPLSPDRAARLWQRYRAAAPQPERPDDLAIAAYADGRLSEEAAADVEAWLAQDPDMLDTVLALRAAPAAASPEPASLDSVRRARALVTDGGAAGGHMPAWRRAVGWSSVAAAMLVAGMLSFQAGRDFALITDPTELNPSDGGFEFTLSAGDADGLL